MLQLFVVITTVVGVVATAPDSQWAVFKSSYGKVYQGNMDVTRRSIWEDNLKTIKRHNELYAKGLSSYFMGENEFADLTHEEFVKTMTGSKGHDKVINQTHTQRRSYNTHGLPSEVNWVKKGYVTSIKNQGQCGSCWAFSSTGSLEGAHFNKTGKLVSLSEKNLMDCSLSFGNWGCGGGDVDKAFQYVIANKGIDNEASYPYQPEGGTCQFNSSTVGARAVSYTLVTSGSEAALQVATATVGPISVCIDAAHSSFQFYKGGVYNNPDCNTVLLLHAVLVVGYGTDDGKEYWLVKNSWGVSWGDKGYIMMTRNKHNQCGIATKAIYPIV